MACCGKVICNGCIHAVKTKTKKHSLCAFCRTPGATSTKSQNERMMKRAETGDALAIYNIGASYFSGEEGYEQNREKALELLQKACIPYSIRMLHNMYVTVCTYVYVCILYTYSIRTYIIINHTRLI